MDSLDPRIQRLNFPKWEKDLEKNHLDQLETYEVFVQTKEGKPYQHEGVVHASNSDMAFLFAKEQFGRRYTCTGMWIARSSDVSVSQTTEADKSVYDFVEASANSDQLESCEVFHLYKRGKQHRHVGAVQAANYEHALSESKKTIDEQKTVYNVWVIKSSDLLKSAEEDKVIWSTLPEKQFRDAIAYKGADKIKEFKEKQANS